MMVRAEVGNQPNMGILVPSFGLAGGSRLASNAVDAVGLVPLPVSIDYWTMVPLTREAFFLQVPLFVAVPEDDIWVPGAAVVGLPIVVSRTVGRLLRREAVVASTDSNNLPNLLFSELLPDNVISFFLLELSFVCTDFLQPFVVILDGLKISG